MLIAIALTFVAVTGSSSLHYEAIRRFDRLARKSTGATPRCSLSSAGWSVFISSRSGLMLRYSIWQIRHLFSVTSTGRPFVEHGLFLLRSQSLCLPQLQQRDPDRWKCGS